jgi:hypothetical protein
LLKQSNRPASRHSTSLENLIWASLRIRLRLLRLDPEKQATNIGNVSAGRSSPERVLHC